jgi:hypothetical protein
VNASFRYEVADDRDAFWEGAMLTGINALQISSHSFLTLSPVESRDLLRLVSTHAEDTL